MCVLLVGLLFVEAILQFIYIYVATLIGQHVIKDMRSKVYNHILKLKMSFFDRTPIEMIETKHIQNKSAFIYESYGVTGSIFISGNGCNKPIHVYTI